MSAAHEDFSRTLRRRNLTMRKLRWLIRNEVGQHAVLKFQEKVMNAEHPLNNSIRALLNENVKVQKIAEKWILSSYVSCAESLNDCRQDLAAEMRRVRGSPRNSKISMLYAEIADTADKMAVFSAVGKDREHPFRLELMQDIERGAETLSGGEASRLKRIKYSEEDAAKDMDDVCSICVYERIAEDLIVELSCKHRFHERCALQWLEGSAHCPLCRQFVVVEYD